VLNPNLDYERYFDHSREDVAHMKWSLGSHITRRSVREFIRLPGSRLLEIGPGYGHFIEELPGSFAEIHAADVAERTIQFARARLARPVHWHVGPLESLQLHSDYFDVVVTMHVIEHIQDDLAFLRECVRILRPGGEIVMLAPGRLSGIAPPEEVRTMGHYRSYNRRRLDQLAESLAGVELEQVAFIHQRLGRLWPGLAWCFHALNYPFRWYLLRDSRSAFERRWYQRLLPRLEDLLNWIDRPLWDREGVLEPYNVLFRLRKHPRPPGA
jgi:ubiquinone/menaquinone biosynthesis C-methylase UbiE